MRRINQINVKRRLLPDYAVRALIILILSNILVYYGARALNAMSGRSYLDMTGIIDRAIPVIPGFSVIYLIAFPFWYATYFFICRSDRSKCFRLVATAVTAKLLCGVLFVMIPTTIIRPEITGQGPANVLLEFIYATDSPDNLFPSIHCLESWLCFLAVNEEEKALEWLKFSAFFLAVAICLSTLFTKQHVVADVIAGVFIADFLWHRGSAFICDVLLCGQDLVRGRKFERVQRTFKRLYL
ncbi:MAG: phosphatase PAP2 family protein [Lachnospiraceae bacterium]|nr:phosphatase PAP2 family protein [Lachnospiraceae bacterium]